MKEYKLVMLFLVGLLTASLGITRVFAAVSVDEMELNRKVIIDVALPTTSRPGIEQQLITTSPTSTLTPVALDHLQILGQTNHTIFLPLIIINDSAASSDTLANKVKRTRTPTATNTFMVPTSTQINPTSTFTFTSTPLLASPTPTPTSTPLPASPTATPTSTPLPASPTVTPTSTPLPVSPTATPTSTPLPVSPTATPLPVNPTATPTSTPLPATPTATYSPTPSWTPTPVTFVTYYVSPNGNDNNAGTILEPWKTIQKAVNTARAGNTVYIRGGTYSSRVVINTYSGSLNNYITFEAYKDETPIIDGTGISITPSAGLIDIRNVTYVRIKGLTIRNSDDMGIYVRNSNNIQILNNRTRDTDSSGVGVWSSSFILVDQNEIVNARNVAYPNGHEESLSIASTTYFEVSNNNISMNAVTAYLGNEGIDVKESNQIRQSPP